MTAVMEAADARLKASIIISSSMRWLLTGALVDCTTNTSEPRTDSWERHRDFAVAEGGHLGFPDPADPGSPQFGGQGRVGIGGKNLDIFPMKVHKSPFILS